MHGLSLFVLVVAAFTFSVVVDVHDLVSGVWFCKCLLSLSSSLVAAAVASHRPEFLMPVRTHWPRWNEPIAVRAYHPFILRYDCDHDVRFLPIA